MRSSHPLAYPLAVSAAAAAGCLALLPLSGPDAAAALTVVVVAVVAVSAYHLARGLRTPVFGTDAVVRRVRQEFRLHSRSWLEITDSGAVRWMPVYFDPALVTAARPAVLRVYPAGRARAREPVGRLIDNPSRPDPEAAGRAERAARWRRRLLLDAQQCVAGPFVGLLWVYVVGGGVPAFLGATLVGALAGLWLSAIRGSDPS